MGYLKNEAVTALEGAMYLLEAAVSVGLISWTAVALAMGQFVLAALLVVALVGVLLRLKRGRLARRKERGRSQ